MRVLEDLIASLREVCSSFEDKRRGLNSSYTMADIGLAAFSVFFLQSPSFLAHQRALAGRRGRSNCASLFAMEKIASDNHIRDMLDSVTPGALFGMFDRTLEALEAGGGAGAGAGVVAGVAAAVAVGVVVMGGAAWYGRRRHC